jgi:hypothetical protein
MFDLSSYSPEFEAKLHGELSKEFPPSEQVKGIFAGVVSSGPFVQFRWADWPEQVERDRSSRVTQFCRDHPYLRPVETGSPAWNTFFDGAVEDSEAANKIADVFGRYTGTTLSWVRAERDPTGTIKASVGFTDENPIDFCLPGCRALNIGSRKWDELCAAVKELGVWAAQR